MQKKDISPLKSEMSIISKRPTGFKYYARTRHPPCCKFMHLIRSPQGGINFDFRNEPVAPSKANLAETVLFKFLTTLPLSKTLAVFQIPFNTRLLLPFKTGTCRILAPTSLRCCSSHSIYPCFCVAYSKLSTS